MKRAIIITLISILPLSASAQEYGTQKLGGFFEDSVTNTGFFSDEQAGIPVKNPTGVITTRPGKDSWTVSSGIYQQPPVAQIVDEAKKQSEEGTGQPPADSFDVREPKQTAD